MSGKDDHPILSGKSLQMGLKHITIPINKDRGFQGMELLTVATVNGRKMNIYVAHPHRNCIFLQLQEHRNDLEGAWFSVDLSEVVMEILALL